MTDKSRYASKRGGFALMKLAKNLFRRLEVHRRRRDLGFDESMPP
jgi:hypothetical protein